MPEVYLALGSNVGDRAQNLRAAVAEIKKIARVIVVSSVYQSKPQGFAEQPDFFNAAIKIETDIPPLELLRQIKDIEKRLGRAPSFKNGPRVIDIDIIFYGVEKINTENLTVPHPRYKERDFVILPLAEINPAIKIKNPRFKSVVKIMQNLL
ncbi:MAG: 2-amino-4-hydroxy-6-hydroxymethyldihydropteridine diphosphokinase [Elusimicrobia bacterium]|nr:2-amino-4-hydroxy-6-hydroxymethyldihydropteridine diphosphokinase [Elusimicrobiota bacterium]